MKPGTKLANLVSGVVLLAACVCLIAGRAAAIDSGKAAPEISGKDMTGKPVSLAALRGKVVIVDFMASWCAPCKVSLPLLDKLYEKHRAAGLVVIGVSVDEKAENLRKFLGNVPVQFSVVHDAAHAAATLYAPARMPSSFIVDKLGTIRYVHGGFRPGDEATIEKEVLALLR